MPFFCHKNNLFLFTHIHLSQTCYYKNQIPQPFFKITQIQKQSYGNLQCPPIFYELLEMKTTYEHLNIICVHSINWLLINNYLHKYTCVELTVCKVGLPQFTRNYLTVFSNLIITLWVKNICFYLRMYKNIKEQKDSST